MLGGMHMRKWMMIFALTAITGLGWAAAHAQAQKETKTPKPSAGISAEFLDQWNRTGQRLVEMAQDFPEDKFDYKAAPTQRTFAEQLLHVAGSNYFFINAASGAKQPDDSIENPSRAAYKTRAQVVAFIQKSYADGAAVIQQQGDKGMLEAVKSPFGNEMYTRATTWTFAMNHANEHYGQCVVYYRLNGLVPPETRKEQQR
jgi:uncharacterized damage-inducible protein DinB